jgi:hypothetical protein
MLFKKTENRKVKQVLSRGWYQWKGGGYKERVKEAECNENIMYSCMKWKNKTGTKYSRNEGRGDKGESWRG